LNRKLNNERGEYSQTDWIRWQGATWKTRPYALKLRSFKHVYEQGTVRWKRTQQPFEAE